MSEGPIQQERRSHGRPRVSTPQSQRLCMVSTIPGRGYCGRKGATTTLITAARCADCMAALRADGRRTP